MSTIKAKPSNSSSSRIAALERTVQEQGAAIAQLQALAQRLVDSQVAVLGTFEQIVAAARKHAEAKQG